jgi:hypothetical protein
LYREFCPSPITVPLDPAYSRTRETQRNLALSLVCTSSRPGPEWCSAPKQSRAQANHRCREYLLALEEERRKIQVFQRELPVSVRAVVFCSFRAVPAPFVRRRFLEEEMPASLVLAGQKQQQYRMYVDAGRTN